MGPNDGSIEGGDVERRFGADGGNIERSGIAVQLKP